MADPAPGQGESTSQSAAVPAATRDATLPSIEVDAPRAPTATVRQPTAEAPATPAPSRHIADTQTSRDQRSQSRRLMSEDEYERPPDLPGCLWYNARRSRWEHDEHGRMYNVEISELDEEELEAYIELRMLDMRGYTDEPLYNRFQDYFSDFTKADFNRAGKDVVQKLRVFLVSGGVFVNISKHTRSAVQVYKALKEEWHEWTREEVNDVLAHKDIPSFNSSFNYVLHPLENENEEIIPGLLEQFPPPSPTRRLFVQTTQSPSRRPSQPNPPEPSGGLRTYFPPQTPRLQQPKAGPSANARQAPGAGKEPAVLTDAQKAALSKTEKVKELMRAEVEAKETARKARLEVINEMMELDDFDPFEGTPMVGETEKEREFIDKKLTELRARRGQKRAEIREGKRVMRETEPEPQPQPSPSRDFGDLRADDETRLEPLAYGQPVGISHEQQMAEARKIRESRGQQAQPDWPQHQSDRPQYQADRERSRTPGRVHFEDGVETKSIPLQDWNDLMENIVLSLGQSQGYRRPRDSDAQALTRELQSFQKSNSIKDDQKYSGSKDVLKKHTDWFELWCQTAGMTEKNRGTAFPNMLTGEALRWYEVNVLPLPADEKPSYERIVEQLKAEFETSIVQSTRRTDYIAFNWKLVANDRENRGKNVLELFNLTINKIQTLYDGLPAHMKIDSEFSEKLWSVLVVVPELKEVLKEERTSSRQFIQKCRNSLTIEIAQQSAQSAARGLKGGQYATEGIDSEGGAFVGETETAVWDGENWVVERKMMGGGWKRGQGGSGGNAQTRGEYRARGGARDRKPGVCYICKKPDCRSWKHSPEEREAAKKVYIAELKKQKGSAWVERKSDSAIQEAVQLLLGKVEWGDEGPTSESLVSEYLRDTDSDDDDDGDPLREGEHCWSAVSGELLGGHTWGQDDEKVENIADELAGLAAEHLLTGGKSPTVDSEVNDDEVFWCFPETDIVAHANKTTPLQPTAKHIPIDSLPSANAWSNDSKHLSKYSYKYYHGVVIDPGAAYWSSGGLGQFRAAQRVWPSLKLDYSSAGEINVGGVGKESFSNVGHCWMEMPFGMVKFYILPIDTPFLLSYADMNANNLYLKNVTQQLIQVDENKKDLRAWQISEKFGHGWINQKSFQAPIEYDEHGLPHTFLTEQELRNIHRRLGHPSIGRMATIIERSGHNSHRNLIERISKYCRLCQQNGSSPGRFKFHYKDDKDFNHTLVIDIFFLDVKGSKKKVPALHVVDEATNFQTARFLRGQTSEEIWYAFRNCWIDCLIGPPDQIIVDAAKNLGSKEFVNHNAEMGTKVIQIATEAHNKVGLVERYHQMLRRAFKIIQEEMDRDKIKVSKEIKLQMACKAVNDTAGPNGYIPTLLVFGAYPRLTGEGPAAISHSRRANAIRKAMDGVRKEYAKQAVNAAKKMRNGPAPKNLQPGSQVWVFREKEKAWAGPWKVVDQRGQTISVQLPNSISDFSSTVCKEFVEDKLDELTYEFPSGPPSSTAPADDPSVTKTYSKLATMDRSLSDSNGEEDEGDEPEDDLDGETESEAPRRSKRAGRFNGTYQLLAEMDDKIANHFAIMTVDATTDLLLSEKEKLDHELSKKLRAEGVIKDSGRPFEAATKKEVLGLFENGTFEVAKLNSAELSQYRIFGARIVEEIKGKNTPEVYEKARLVIRGYNDAEKASILTQSPTIQRVSMRVICALAASLGLSKGKVKLLLRDISQAYTQSTTPLQRMVLVRPPPQVLEILAFPPGTIFRMKKPLYGLAEAGNHWYVTYITHITDKLKMEPSTYDSCFLISKPGAPFGITALQVDDSLYVCDDAFAANEDLELKRAKLLAKPAIELKEGEEFAYNGVRLRLQDGFLWMLPKHQGEAIQLVDPDDPDFAVIYKSQRARGAYVAGTCQPWASFTLAQAAQALEITSADIKLLNRILKRQKEQSSKGLRFVETPISRGLKLFAFPDGSFANNRDFTSQIGYVIVLGWEEQTGDGEFTIHGNIVHYSSTKCKRVTRAVLASELYAMVAAVDISIPIASTLKKVTDLLGESEIPLVVCTDSYSLYQCLVKLGTTEEKRLMIDVMALRESYERREIVEIRWIAGTCNPADAMTKLDKANGALEELVATNKLVIRVEGWVERKGKEKEEE